MEECSKQATDLPMGSTVLPRCARSRAPAQAGSHHDTNGSGTSSAGLWSQHHRASPCTGHASQQAWLHRWWLHLPPRMLPALPWHAKTRG